MKVSDIVARSSNVGTILVWQELGDTTTLAEPEVVHELIANHVLG